MQDHRDFIGKAFLSFELAQKNLLHSGTLSKLRLFSCGFGLVSTLLILLSVTPFSWSEPLSSSSSSESRKLAQSKNDQNAQDYVDSLGGKVDYWHPEKMPLKVWIKTDAAVPHFKEYFKDYFLAACNSWAKASEDMISFKFVDKDPCDIEVFWTADQRTLLNQGELGEATWSNDPDGLYRARIKLLTVADNGRRPISDAEAKLMCLHELGHALGLVKHSPFTGDIMNACVDFNYKTPLEKLDLSPRDKRSIYRLYSEADALVDRLSAESDDPRAKLMRLCFRAAKLIDAEKYDPAYLLLERALAIDPSSPQALSAMSACCFEQGMYLYSAGHYQAACLRLEKFLELAKQMKMDEGPQSQEARRMLEASKTRLRQKVPGV